MGKRRSAEPLVKVTLNIFERDYDRLKELYDLQGATVAIRAIVRHHVSRVEKRIAESNEVLVSEIDIDLEGADV